MLYLASPYSHPDADMRRRRFEAVAAAAADLINDGKVVFCPIAHSHPIELYGGIPGTWEIWREQDIPFLDNCTEFAVLCLDGWQQSVGVQAELKHFVQTNPGVTPIFIKPKEDVL